MFVLPAFTCMKEVPSTVQWQVCIPVCTTAATAPLFTSYVHAGATGFPSPADDYVEMQLDLNSYVSTKPHATFYVKARGDSMRDLGIQTGDVLVVDRSLRPAHGDIAVCVIAGELLVKRLEFKGQDLYLVSAHPAYPPVRVESSEEFVLWGVVTGIVKLLRRSSSTQ